MLLMMWARIEFGQSVGVRHKLQLQRGTAAMRQLASSMHVITGPCI